MKFWLYILFALSFIGPSSFAYESDDEYGYHHQNEVIDDDQYQVNQGDATRFQKFDAALEALGIPEETAPDFSNFVHANEVNQKEVQDHLRYIDPDQGLSRYLSIASGNIQLFRDFFKSMISLNYLEYQQTISTENASNDSSALIERLKSVARHSQSNNIYPLHGLKVLIDPGHMGGKDWDTLTGKFVKANGNQVSEGYLNLWTSLLVAQKLEKLGAIVMLTRQHAGSVSAENYKTFDITPYLNTFFYNSMDDWMAPYLTKSISEVKSSVVNDPMVSKAYSHSQRLQFFISGADLEARSKIIDHFNPDVTLDIHYDASDNVKTQTTTQALEAFVPGAFMKNETGSRKVKAMALKHLLEVRRFNQSVELADKVTQSMSTALRIKRLKVPKAYFTPPAYALKVRDGVYARNLYISRRALSSLVVYLECMHYDYAKEHSRLSVRDSQTTYNGTTFHYPSRLNTVAAGIENGFLSYFRNMNL